MTQRGGALSMGYPAIAGASALTLNYDYDVTGNVTAIRENGATSGSGVLASYGYDALGRRASLTYGNSVTQSYSFDGTQRLDSIASNLAGSAQDVTASLTYNPASQLDSVTKSIDAYAYTPVPAQDVVSAANGLNQLTTATPGAGQTSVPGLSYDARGNLTGIGASSYSYSSENLLKTGPGGVTLDYDPAMRLAKIASGGPATRFAYDGTDLIAEYAGGALLRRYVHGPGSDEPLVAYEGAGLTTKRWLTADERGSIIAVTDGSGSSIATNRYDEYGQPASTNASVANGGRFQYTGQSWLPELGLYYYKSRIYSPVLGRFMQVDPIGYGDGMNMYNYVGSDPVNFVDPNGTCSFTLWGIFEHEEGQPPEAGTLLSTYVEMDTPCRSPEYAEAAINFLFGLENMAAEGDADAPDNKTCGSKLFQKMLNNKTVRSHMRKSIALGKKNQNAYGFVEAGFWAGYASSKSNSPLLVSTPYASQYTNRIPVNGSDAWWLGIFSRATFFHYHPGGTGLSDEDIELADGPLPFNVSFNIVAFVDNANMDAECHAP